MSVEVYYWKYDSDIWLSQTKTLILRKIITRQKIRSRTAVFQILLFYNIFLVRKLFRNIFMAKFHRRIKSLIDDSKKIVCFRVFYCYFVVVTLHHIRFIKETFMTFLGKVINNVKNYEKSKKLLGLEFSVILFFPKWEYPPQFYGFIFRSYSS